MMQPEKQPQAFGVPANPYQQQQQQQQQTAFAQPQWQPPGAGGGAAVGVPVAAPIPAGASPPPAGGYDAGAAVGVPAVGVPAQPVMAEYPNPCGRGADVCGLRDVWFAVAWLISVAIVFGRGGSKLAAGDTWQTSHGSARWQEYPVGGCSGDSFLVLETDSTTGACSEVGGGQWAAVGCTDEQVFVSHSFSDPAPMSPAGADSGQSGGEPARSAEAECSARLGSISKLSTAPGVLRASVSEKQVACADIMTAQGPRSISLHSQSCGTKSMSVLLAGVLLLAIFLAGAMAAAQLSCIKCAPVACIKGCFITMIALVAAMGLVAMMSGGFFMGIIMLLLAAFYGWWFWQARSRIPHAALCLETAIRLVQCYWGTIVNAFFFLFIQFVFVVFWCYAIGSKEEAVAIGGIFYLFLLFYYWGNEVFRNIVHVTTSGVVADWFFSASCPQSAHIDANQQVKQWAFVRPPNHSPTPSSLKRATTSSLGSICFGSLIVAIIQLIRQLVRSMRDDQRFAILMCLIDCILGCIESLMRLFNDYAYVQVAVYGKPYIQAGKDTYELVTKTPYGIETLIRDCLVDSVFTIMSLGGGLVIGALMYAVFGGVGFGLLGFIVGLVVLMLVFRCVYSAILTVMLCFFSMKRLSDVHQVPLNDFRNAGRVPIAGWEGHSKGTDYEQQGLLSYEGGGYFSDPKHANGPSPRNTGQ